MTSLGMVTIDTGRPRELAAWWAERLGGEIVQDHEGYFCVVRAPDVPVALGFQLVDDPTPGKNRLHLDFDRGTATRDELIASYVSAGAEHRGTRGEAGFQWDTFADIDGNEFCVGDPH